ncbi:MAG: GrpB family protein [Ruthenibacterium lactatiformans]
MQHITVVPYDPAWSGLYEAEAQAIAGVLGQRLTAIHHIGSTAVPGLAAKPVIDIMPVVRAVTEADECRADFEALGYEYLGEFGIPGRRYLRKAAMNGRIRCIFLPRTMCAPLRGTSRAGLSAPIPRAAAYGALKLELAARFPYDIDGYCDGKDAFVGALERDALEWRAACDLKNGSNKA